MTTRTIPQCDIGCIAQATPTSSPRSRVWLWVCAVFALQLTVWTIWIVIASHHKVEEVPLTTAVSWE